MGVGQNSLENLRAAPFNKDLSNETTFNPLDSTFNTPYSTIIKNP
jgi:hypothetical protein